MLSQRSQNYECTIYYHIMIVVGAIIGGITNVIAIRMLFHPLNHIIYLNLESHFTQV